MHTRATGPFSADERKGKKARRRGAVLSLIVLSLLASCAGDGKSCSRFNPISPEKALFIAKNAFRQDVATKAAPIVRAEEKFPLDCCKVERQSQYLDQFLPVREFADEYIVHVQSHIYHNGSAFSGGKFYLSSCGKIMEEFIDHEGV